MGQNYQKQLAWHAITSINSTVSLLSGDDGQEEVAGPCGHWGRWGPSMLKCKTDIIMALPLLWTRWLKQKSQWSLEAMVMLVIWIQQNCYSMGCGNQVLFNAQKWQPCFDFFRAICPRHFFCHFFSLVFSHIRTGPNTLPKKSLYSDSASIQIRSN